MENRKREWQTHLGNSVTVEGCSDEHLANTLQYLKYYNHPDIKMVKLLEKEAKKRGLTEEFLSRAQFPYKDGKGNWLVWCFKTNAPKIVGSYVRG